ncbi:DUF1801 domain-containing protein [Flavobacterium capsici]|uniref:DUF1801 domain-containing protein n=1 Tax=Flavobacterium capsici TaxID=3075618 RepID=A0AA96F0G0_9FLAO|nr:MULTISPECIES: DUF1801 domain-containing protein [unclassified Flavobacterium]WNM20112.1 DUF1801 domain-containing protein [Flavobacterium sp. PMR2A8]WNM21502.1 DUF1801 domain-containing protein [Flavobacterium sp. PMTSA4]
MAELKTKKTEESVERFLKTIADEQKQKDAFELVKLMEEATKSKGKMWGTAIVGFGDTVLKYDNGRELDWFIMGFSPRKQNLALYISNAVRNEADREKLGKHKVAKSCLYINKISDIDVAVLKEIIKNGL